MADLDGVGGPGAGVGRGALCLDFPFVADDGGWPGRDCFVEDDADAAGGFFDDDDDDDPGVAGLGAAGEGAGFLTMTLVTTGPEPGFFGPPLLKMDSMVVIRQMTEWTGTAAGMCTRV